MEDVHLNHESFFVEATARQVDPKKHESEEGIKLVGISIRVHSCLPRRRHCEGDVSSQRARRFACADAMRGIN
jgi:hypothetical protein